MKHFLGPILGAEVAQKRAPFPAVVTRTEMGNANICILCDAVKKVERRVRVHRSLTACLTSFSILLALPPCFWKSGNLSINCVGKKDVVCLIER